MDRKDPLIECPVCKRLTWPNLGVNMPAGAAVSLGSGNNKSFAGQIVGVKPQHDNDNPLWQGPCTDGPLGGITQSMLIRFLSCRERFRLKFVCGLEPHAKWNYRLGYGQMWHVCEEALASGNGPATTLWEDMLREHTAKQMTDYPLQRGEIEKWYNVCLVQFPEYVEYWRGHPDVTHRVPLLQEQVFDVPYKLPSGRVVRLRGRWDSVDLIDGGIYIQENKTKGDINKEQIERQLAFDLQSMFYLIATQWVQNAGSVDQEKWSHPIKGVIYNVVRRPLSGGKGSISPHKAKATKHTYIPAESAEQFFERLRRDYITAEPEYWFFRIRAEISNHDIDVFRKTCLDPLLETVCWWYESVTKNSYRLPSHHLVERAMNYRTPFGVYSVLEEGGATEYDAYLATGSMAGLKQVEELFTELKE